MFGPNARATFDGKAAFHHRGLEYRELLDQLCHEFSRRWGYDRDYLFLSGSGTMANEAVFFSSLQTFSTPNSGYEFTKRLAELAVLHHKHDHGSRDQAWAQYETAESRYFPPPKNPGHHFADCVSAFPYYDPPEDAKVWSTVSSKQLGALPVCSIIAVDKQAWSRFADTQQYSILNLSRYREAQAHGTSPHTPAIALLDDLLKRVQNLQLTDFRTWIDHRRELVAGAFPDSWGEGPVVNIPLSCINPVDAERERLYKSQHGYQLFLYSEKGMDDAAFMRWLKELRKIKSM